MIQILLSLTTPEGADYYLNPNSIESLTSTLLGNSESGTVIVTSSGREIVVRETVDTICSLIQKSGDAIGTSLLVIKRFDRELS